jgi:polyphosphate kinase 2
MTLKKFDEFNESILSRTSTGLKTMLKGISKNFKSLLSSIKDDYKKGYISEQIKEDILKSLDSIKSLDNIAEVTQIFNDNLDSNVIRYLNIESLISKMRSLSKDKWGSVIDKYKKTLDSRIDFMVDRIDDEWEYEEEGETSILPSKVYYQEKEDLQVELLKLQEWVLKNKKKVCLVFEGRDAAGKGSTIKRFTEYMMPKNVRVVALGIPTEEEKNNWFERYEKYMPKEGEIVFFDRSWYNRAVTEPVMGYCSEEQYMTFMDDVNEWERKLVEDEDVILIKFWFSITKDKQQLRFQLRQNSPLKYWKFSPNDAKSMDKWDVYTKFKDQMFRRTSSKQAPWVIVNSNDKRLARLNSIRYVLSQINYENKNSEIKPYPEVVTVVK